MGFCVGALCFAGFLPTAFADSGKWSGHAAVEGREFPAEPLLPEQEARSLSMAVQPEYYREWDGGRQSFTAVLFGRVDSADPERTHWDVRELTWVHVGEGSEWRVGIRKVFWGVAESRHLVDILNQTDLVENPDKEEKLGQPMINLALIRPWGTVDLFLLAGFRDRTFPGEKGRLRTPVPVATKNPVFESSRGRGQIDLAVRYAFSRGIWDLGISDFCGTSREPRLVPDTTRPEAPFLIPYYDLIHQSGLDLQATRGKGIWKLEGIRRTGQGAGFYSLTGGVEYTLSGILGSAIDLGVIGEYLYDDRGESAPTPFQDDLMGGLRWVLNDIQGTEVLIGVIADREGSARFLNLEGGRRIGNRWKLNLEGRIFTGIPETDPLRGVRNDDYLQVEWVRYF